MEENYNSGQQETQNTEQYQYTYNSDYNYNQPQNYNQENNAPMSVGEWLLTILATLVPCLGLILYLVWAFGNGTNINKKNYCKAWLIYWVIVTVLEIILIIVLFAVFVPALSSQYYYYY